MMLIAAAAVIVLMAASACSRQPVHTPPTVQGQNIAVAVSQLTPDVPRFFTYQHEGRHISFFVINIDRRVISFLDACASCYSHKRGYRYDANEAVVTCRYCDMRFSIYKLEKGLGGCYPIRISGSLEKGDYLIPLASLKAEAAKF
jgi:uncharacterized membrane protein